MFHAITESMFTWTLRDVLGLFLWKQEKQNQCDAGYFFRQQSVFNSGTIIVREDTCDRSYISIHWTIFLCSNMECKGNMESIV